MDQEVMLPSGQWMAMIDGYPLFFASIDWFVVYKFVMNLESYYMFGSLESHTTRVLCLRQYYGLQV